ncbi:MAG: creatininase family protein [Armatimonadota bacterium]
MSIHFAELTSPELDERACAGALVVMPVGTIEQHGAHLPVNTDVIIAESLAREAAREVADEIPVLLMPAVWTGYSGNEVARWCGTIRVRTRVFANVILDVCRSLIQMGFTRIVVINAHGHHPAILEMAAREVADECGVYIAIVDAAKMAAEAFQACRKSPPGGAVHGGEYETSLMLHLGHRVELERATDGEVMRYRSEFFPGDGFAGSKKAFWSTWGLQQSRTGVYGDPTVASAETGKVVFEAAVEQCARFLREYYAKHTTDEEHDRRAR